MVQDGPAGPEHAENDRRLHWRVGGEAEREGDRLVRVWVKPRAQQLLGIDIARVFRRPPLLVQAQQLDGAIELVAAVAVAVAAVAVVVAVVARRRAREKGSACRLSRRRGSVGSGRAV